MIVIHVFNWPICLTVHVYPLGMTFASYFENIVALASVHEALSSMQNTSKQRPSECCF